MRRGEAKLKRTLDATFLNVVANFPGVREQLGGEGPIDLREIVENPVNFCFVNAFGGFVLVAKAPGLYEVHTICPRGPRAAIAMHSLARAAQDFMFSATDCMELMTLAPRENVPAGKLAKLCGFSWFGETPAGEILHMTLDDWLRRSAEALATGRAFHELLHRAGAAAHADLPFHDRAVGAALMMIRAGQIAKAMAFYNRLATLLSYSPPVVLTPSPLVLNIGQAIVTLRAGEVEILKCL